jgi:hypothetical protein
MMCNPSLTIKGTAPSRPDLDQFVADVTTYVPRELRDRPQWVVWRIEHRDGKPTKVLYCPGQARRRASSTDPGTWDTLDGAIGSLRKHGDWLQGVGYVFSKDDPYTGIDFDKCIGPDGNILGWAKDKVESLLPSYAEISPSGTGIKVFVRGELRALGGKCDGTGSRRNGYGPDKAGAIEIYDKGRFFTVTADVLTRCRGDILDRQEQVDAIYREVKKEGEARPAGGKTGGKSKFAAKATGGGGPITTDALIDDDGQVERLRTEPHEDRDAFVELFDRGDIGRFDGDHSDADFALAKIIGKAVGNDPARVERIFNRSALARRGKWKDRRDYRERTIRNALAELGQGPRATSAPTATRRVQIEIPKDDRSAPFDATMNALRDVPGLYRRGDALVHTLPNESDTVHLSGGAEMENAAGMLRLVPLTEPLLGVLLSRHVSYFRWKVDKQGEATAVAVEPPSWLLSSVLQARAYVGVPEIRSVAECPFVRPDGTIVDRVGFDPATGTLLASTVEGLDVPSRPTREQIGEAVGKLYKVVAEFPFESSTDEAAWLAAALTAIQRPAIRGPVPGFAMVGNTAGVGKGKLVDCCGMLATGRTIPTSPYPSDETEAAKVKLSLALDGVSLVHFDNVPNGSEYGCGAMDSAITTCVASGRILGQSRDSGAVPLRPGWFLTGNNCTPGADAARRWLRVGVDTKTEFPERQAFTLELPGYVAENRAELLSAALTILVAHAQAGRPGVPGPDGKPQVLGSFEDWNAVVRGAVFYAVNVDPVAAPAPRHMSEAKQQLSALLLAWADLPGQECGLRVAEVLRLARQATADPALADALRQAIRTPRGEGGLPTDRQLGNFIREHNRQPVGNLRFTQKGEDRKGFALWAVEKV